MKNLIMKARVNMMKGMVSVRGILTDRSGSGMIDLAINLMISVVLGALVLAGLYLLFGSTILPLLSEKIKDIFNYQG
jgi:succinate dehydrogenase hydrophobic anchor subunit